MLRRRGARIAETPILFADREQGTSKINSREALAAAADHRAAGPGEHHRSLVCDSDSLFIRHELCNFRLDRFGPDLIAFGR